MMIDKSILRTPDLSGSRIVLKTSKDGIVGTAAEKHHNENIEASFQSDLISEQGVSEKYKEYVSKLESLEQEKDQLEQIAKKIADEREQLDAEKQAYREELEQKVKSEIEDKVKNEYSERNAELLALIDALEECKNSEILNYEDELIAVAYESVCKIIGQAMTDTSIVTSIVRETISHAQDRMQMIIRVSPHDFDIIQNAKEMLSRGLTNRLEVVADDHVNYGGCILETDAGTIDGRLEQQLNSFLELLLDERERTEKQSG